MRIAPAYAPRADAEMPVLTAGSLRFATMHSRGARADGAVRLRRRPGSRARRRHCRSRFQHRDRAAITARSQHRGEIGQLRIVEQLVAAPRISMTRPPAQIRPQITRPQSVSLPAISSPGPLRPRPGHAPCASCAACARRHCHHAGRGAARPLVPLFPPRRSATRLLVCPEARTFGHCRRTHETASCLFLSEDSKNDSFA